MSEHVWIRIGAISGFLAVALGAFGAHALEERLTTNQTLDIWETASRYHLVHTLAMILPVCTRKVPLRPALWFGLGCLIFSGSLYLLAFANWRWLGMVTPVGGLCFLIGWGRLAWLAGSVKLSQSSDTPS